MATGTPEVVRKFTSAANALVRQIQAGTDVGFEHLTTRNLAAMLWALIPNQTLKLTKDGQFTVESRLFAQQEMDLFGPYCAAEKAAKAVLASLGISRSDNPSNCAPVGRIDSKILANLVKSLERLREVLDGSPSQQNPSMTVGQIVVGNVINSSLQAAIGRGNVQESSDVSYQKIHEVLKQCGISPKESNELKNILDDLENAKPEQRPAIQERGRGWLARNAGSVGEFIGGMLRGWFET